MSQLKTLIFHPAMVPYRLDLFNRLCKKLDLQVFFFADHVTYHRDLNQYSLLYLLKCNHEYLLKGFRILNRDFCFGIGRVIRDFRPDVVVSHEFSYATLSVMFYRKIMSKESFGHTVWTAENIHMLEGRGIVRQTLRKMCCHAADCLIVYTDEVREAFARRWLPSERIFVCANHQEEKSFSKKLDAARPLVDECLHKHSLKGKKIVLFVGRLAPEKNLTRLIDAFGMATRAEQNAVLVLVGDGPERKTLKIRSQEAGIGSYVLFPGHQEGSELYVWYLLCSFLVLPSTWEPYGAVVNEALLAGKPVLCSSHAGAHVLIREGKNGYMFDPYDIDGLANLIEKSLAISSAADTACRFSRKNLIPVSFERDVASFVKAIEYAAKAPKQNYKKVNAHE